MEGIQCETLWPASQDDFCAKGGRKATDLFWVSLTLTWHISAGPHPCSDSRATHVLARHEGFHLKGASSTTGILVDCCTVWVV